MTVDTGCALINISRAAKELAAEVRGQQERKKKTLLDTPDLQIFLLYVRTGGYVPAHQVEGPITVQTLIGKIRMKAEGIEHQMPAGTMLVLGSTIPHDVFGENESVALVTIVKKPQHQDI
jgi:quercetin dioxygenase-like cupin family protein